MSLRNQLVKLAHTHPEMRTALKTLLKRAATTSPTQEGAKSLFDAYRKEHPATEKTVADFYEKPKAEAKETAPPGGEKQAPKRRLSTLSDDEFSAMLDRKDQDRTVNLTNEDLTKRSFSRIPMRNVNFTGSEFKRGANFYSCKATASKFNEAELYNAQFGSATLHNTTFDSANCQSAEFQQCEGISTSFKKADLTNSHWSGCNLRNANFEGAALKNADMSKGKFSNSSFKEADLKSVNFDEATLSGCDFTGAKNIPKQAFKKAVFKEAPKGLPAPKGREGGWKWNEKKSVVEYGYSTDGGAFMRSLES